MGDGKITCYNRAFVEGELPVLQLMKMQTRNNYNHFIAIRSVIIECLVAL